MYDRLWFVYLPGIPQFLAAIIIAKRLIAINFAVVLLSQLENIMKVNVNNWISSPIIPLTTSIAKVLFSIYKAVLTKEQNATIHVL